MQIPVYEQIRETKVRALLRMLHLAQPVSCNISQTCRSFDVSRNIFYVSKLALWELRSIRFWDLPRTPHHIRF
jgi:hypothetical protein